MLLLFFKNKFALKRSIFKFFTICLIWFLFVYIIRSLLFGLLSRYEHVDVYDYAAFDFVVNGPYIDHYNREISTQPFIQNEIKTILTGGDLKCGDEYGTTSTMNIDDNDFNSLFVIFPRRLFVSIDESLLTRQDGIFLSFSLAQNMNLKPGDIVSISGREKIVIGIYEDSVSNVIHADSITLWDEAYGEQFQNIGFRFYSKVYIKASDYDAASTYLEATYFTHSDYITNIIGNGEDAAYVKQYGDLWIEKAIEEAINDKDLNRDYQLNAFLKQKTLKAYAVNEYKVQYNLNQDITYSVISVIALFAVCILESYRHAKENQQKFAILRMMGSRRSGIWTFYFMRSFILQTMLMLLAIAYVRYMTYENIYVSGILTLQWMLYFEAVIFVAALVSSAASMRKLTDRELLSSLNEEGSVD